MTAYHVGIDLHKLVAQVCVRNSAGEVCEERRFRLESQAERERLLDWLAALGPHLQLAVEALGCNRWFVLACLERELKVLVVDPTQLDLKRTGKKTDKRDAREIARRLHLGDLERHARTYFPTEAEYAARKLLRSLRRLTQLRTSLVAQIRGILNAYAVRPPSDSLYTKATIAWLRALTWAEEDLAVAFRELVNALEAIHRSASKVRVRLRKAVRQDEVAAAMMKELPQAAEQTVFTIRAELGDVHRFQNSRQVSAYGGLVARVSASADRSHHGRITKRGNRELRYIMGQWAVRLLKSDALVRRWAEPLLRRMHKNKVRTALARRLLVGVWVMLKRGEVFSMEACLSLAA